MVQSPQPRISLLIANYWDGDIIRETLESVREDEPIEVVAIDDASPDSSTTAKLRGYRDEGLITTLILSDENVGASKSLNRAAEQATGKYLCLFGNDDLLLPGSLGAMADALDADPGATFAAGDFEYFGARPGLRRSAPWDPWRALTRNAWNGTLFVRREAYFEVDGLTSDCIAQDWDFYLGMASKGYRGVVLDRTIFRYRIHEHAGRESTAARRAYSQEVRTMRRRHAPLFARERELRKASDAGLRERLFWGLMYRIAPHRPGVLTDIYFHLATAVARVKRLLRTEPPAAAP